MPLLSHARRGVSSHAPCALPCPAAVNPPAGILPGSVEKYIVQLCPSTADAVQPPASCPAPVEVECASQCLVPSLLPGQRYWARAYGVISGRRGPASNVLPVTLPRAGAPALVAASSTGSTTATATAAHPADVQYIKVGGLLAWPPLCSWCLPVHTGSCASRYCSLQPLPAWQQPGAVQTHLSSPAGRPSCLPAVHFHGPAAEQWQRADCGGVPAASRHLHGPAAGRPVRGEYCACSSSSPEMPHRRSLNDFAMLTLPTDHQTNLLQVVVVGVTDSAQSVVSNTARFVTAAAGAPVLAARSTAPGSGEAVVAGPPGDWQAYRLTICPVERTGCTTSTCAKQAQGRTTCRLEGLEQGVTYVVVVR